MITLAVLVVYTTCVLLWGPRLTAGRAWTSSSPVLGLLLCQAVSVAAVSGVLLIAARTAVSVQHVRPDIGHLLHACVVTVWDSARHPGVVGTTVMGLAALGLLSHVGRTAAASTMASRRVRRRQREGLALVGQGADDSGVAYTRVRSEQKFAYCLPGRGGSIVVSTAAEHDLRPDQLRAVLAHERAHLRGRHHVIVLVTHVLARAAPLPSVRTLHHEVCSLVEMAADDRACREVDREDLLGALLRLGTQVRMGPALSVNGPGALRRALRLLEPAATQSARRSLTVWVASFVMVAVPWLLGGVPAALALTGHCEL